MTLFRSNDPIAWCPGCGNFGILTALRSAFQKMGKKPSEILLVSGIGQAGKTPHYIEANCFNGLHGRALPVAQAAKMVNPKLTVIVTTGDGDCYGEGGNHLVHAIRRNVDITVIVHNNQVYGLTKGQASPTTQEGAKTKVQPQGVILEPMHALAMAVALGAGFVARSFSANQGHLVSMIEKAVNYPGFSLLEILQPCITYNEINTYEWYAKRVYDLGERGPSMSDKAEAFRLAEEWGDRIPIGCIFRDDGKRSYEKKSGIDARKPAVEEDIDDIAVDTLFTEFE